MNKLDMQSKDVVNENIEKISELFPNVIVESEKGKQIDFDLLKQELSKEIVEENKEKYQLTWPGKKEAIVNANTSCTKTLRIIEEKSVNYEYAKNVYIEGDNLDALKILQESYLRKIDCIYIDPPYNTGSDLIYNDKFDRSSRDELYESGQTDKFGCKMITNNESNGKFHSNWLSMIYPRIKLARNLLKDEGIIFISIDENEYVNLRKVCDEIFGEQNYIGDIIRKTKSMTNDSSNGFNNQHEYLLIYCKAIEKANLVGETKNFDNYKNPDNDINGEWCSGDPSAKSGGDSTYFGIENPYTKKIDYPPEGRYWAFSKASMEEYIKNGKIKFKEKYSDNERGFVFKRYKKDLKTTLLPLDSLCATSNEYMNQVATKELSNIMGKNVFSYPKPKEFIKMLLKSLNNKDAVVLDFFSGSATTAQAVLELNQEDGGSREFILVQIEEVIGENETICDIALERIEKINLDKNLRVYRIDSSNMKDVYYMPNELKQSQLGMFESNIKEDRKAIDLLTQVILDLGLTLDLIIEEKFVLDNKIYFVDDNSLIACFDNEININVVDEICKYNPLKVVFKDESFKVDNDKINLQERFKKLSPNTEICIL